MVDGKMLTEKTKEELIRIILEKDKLVDELAAKVKELEEKVKGEQEKERRGQSTDSGQGRIEDDE